MNLEQVNIHLQYGDHNEPYFNDEIEFLRYDIYTDNIDKLKCDVKVYKDKYGEFNVDVENIVALDSDGNEVETTKNQRVCFRMNILSVINLIQ